MIAEVGQVSLDCFEFGPDMGLSCSAGRQIVLLGKKSVLLFTFERNMTVLSDIRRVKWTTPYELISAKFGPIKVDGHHLLGILDRHGDITIYKPKLDPTRNAWTVSDQLSVDGSCFDWAGNSIIYGRRDGSVLLNGRSICRRDGRIPTAIKVDNEDIVVGWDDGLVELFCQYNDSRMVLSDDGCWLLGPIMSRDLFSKVNRIYKNRHQCGQALPILSPIVGLTKDIAFTRDGHAYQTKCFFPEKLPVDFVRIVGVIELPYPDLVAVSGISKGQSVLCILEFRNDDA